MNKKAIVIGLVLLAAAGAALAYSKRAAGDVAPADTPPEPVTPDPAYDPAAADWIGYWTNQNAEEIQGNNVPINTIEQPSKLSAEGRASIEAFEGFSAKPYADFKGNSIGFGHLIKPGENLTTVTREQASEILASDIVWAENAVRDAVTAAISQGQFDALVSLCFNIGQSAFKKSTLVKKLNAGDAVAAAAEFDRWNKAGGAVNVALVQRRASERQAFETAMA